MLSLLWKICALRSHIFKFYYNKIELEKQTKLKKKIWKDCTYSYFILIDYYV